MNDSLPYEIGVSDASNLRNSPEKPLFLDVREPFEVETAHLDPDLHIPMQSITEQWADLPKDRPVLVYCHHGMRSLRVTEYLRSRGVAHAQSISGGIDAWSREIDPSIPRY
tara:strand:- start:5112 stop:5444 length:333 start_codon:yes stop_codon:yes gene_type:complete